MARLTAELSLQGSATEVMGGDLVILARAGMPQSHEGLARVGERRLMIPPMGMCHAAWADASIVEPYLAFAKQYLKAKVYAWLVEALGLIRRRGYTLAAHASTSTQLQQAKVVRPEEHRVGKGGVGPGRSRRAPCL